MRRLKSSVSRGHTFTGFQKILASQGMGVTSGATYIYTQTQHKGIIVTGSHTH